jgi:hypothetical protein
VFKRYVPWCDGLDHAMSDWLSRPVWETLPPERQHGLVRTLGQMAIRQIRIASTAHQMTVGEIADDDRTRSHAAAAGRAVGENLSPPS